MQPGHSDRRKRETPATTELSKSWESCPACKHQSSAWRLNGVTAEKRLGQWIVSHGSLFLPPWRYADTLHIRGEQGSFCCILLFVCPFGKKKRSLAVCGEVETHQNRECQIGKSKQVTYFSCGSQGSYLILRSQRAWFVWSFLQKKDDMMLVLLMPYSKNLYIYILHNVRDGFLWQWPIVACFLKGLKH